MDASWYPPVFFGVAALILIVVVALFEVAAYLDDHTHWID